MRAGHGHPTKTNIALAELVEKAKRARTRNLLQGMIQYVAQRMIDMDVESLCAAGYAEKSPGPSGSTAAMPTGSGSGRRGPDR